MVERAKRGNLGLHPSSRGIFFGFRRAALLTLATSVFRLAAGTALAQTCNNYGIAFLGSSFDGANTTYSYQISVCALPIIQDWMLGLPDCVSCSDIDSAGLGSWEFKSALGLTGVKFKTQIEYEEGCPCSGGISEITLRYNGNVGDGITASDGFGQWTADETPHTFTVCAAK